MLVIVTFTTGLLFGLGLALSEMTNPAVVLGFLNIGGDWKPNLLFVMAAAVAISALAYIVKRHQLKPFIASDWQIASRRDIDKNLISGAVLFGFGWGLSGYCPGPGLIALFNRPQEGVYFVLALLAGSAIFQLQPHRNNA